jgi:hypothetical protein
VQRNCAARETVETLLATSLRIQAFARRLNCFDEVSTTCTRAQQLPRSVNNFHAASTTCTKIQQLSSKIMKNAIRGDLALWKTFADPKAGSPCKNRTTGSPAALASILWSRQHERKRICQRDFGGYRYSWAITTLSSSLGYTRVPFTLWSSPFISCLFMSLLAQPSEMLEPEILLLHSDF